jgi:hypothetical protein
MNIYTFMSGSPFLTAWLGIIAVAMAHYVFNSMVRIFSRTIRAINISVRGWPPPHCDADGDAIK